MRLADLAASQRTVGLIPAAGLATRAQPLVGSKEMCEVWGKPALLHLVSRMQEAPVQEIRLSTRREKTDVLSCASSAGVAAVVGEPADVAASLRLAAAGAEADVFLVGFPDTVWGDDGVFPSLVSRLGEPGADVALGLFRTADPSAVDVVQVEADGRVTRIDVKPAAPRGNWTWGCAAIRPDVLQAFTGSEPGDTFDALARQGRVSAKAFQGPYVDIGVRWRLDLVLGGASLEEAAAGLTGDKTAAKLRRERSDGAAWRRRDS